MTGISHFCIKPLVLSRLECTEHAEWPTWSNPTPSNPAPKIRGCGIFFPGCRCFFAFFFQDIDSYVIRMYTKFGSYNALERTQSTNTGKWP